MGRMFQGFYDISTRQVEAYTEHGALQMRWELDALCDIVEKLRPRVSLEIGTLTGGSLARFLEVVPQDSLIISVDLPGVHITYGDTYKDFNPRDIDLRLVSGNSHDPSTLREVIKISDDLDFVFIDGDHSYHSVRADFNLYAPLVRRGGIVALHDILYNPNFPDFGACPFWYEIKRAGYLCQELYARHDQEVAGIGVVYL